MQGRPIALGLTLVFSLLLSACSSLDIPPPSEARTLLVIAKSTQNKSFDSWARRYSIELEKLDGQSAGNITEVWFDNNRETFALESELEPGRYSVNRLKWISAAGWRFTQAMGEGYPIEQEFQLREGQLTLLPIEFSIKQTDNGSGILSQFWFETVTAERRHSLIEQIQLLPNAQHWPILPAQDG